MGDVLVVDVHAVPSQLLDGGLHVDDIPVHDGIEGEAKAAQLLLLALLERASDFATLAVVDTAGEAVTQFRVIELGQDALDIFLAKYLCGSPDFSNMFCEASEALA